MLVSVVVATYNHGKYIAQTIEGLLMQQTDFRVEILINDDASTDETAAIVRNYQSRYPFLFKNFYQQENLYSKGIKPWFDILFPAASGKYIALCEGDDYWTDSTKLQTQARLLEANPAYSLVAGGYKEKYENSGEERTHIHLAPKEAKAFNGGFEITREIFSKKWYLHTLTVFFRKEWIGYTEFKKYKSAKDAHLFFYLIDKGPGFYLTRELAVYRKHTGNVFGTVGRVAQLARLYKDYKSFYHFHPEDFRSKYRHILQNILALKRNEMNDSLPKRTTVYLELFRLIETENDFFELCKFANIKSPRLISIVLRMLRLMGKIK